MAGKSPILMPTNTTISTSSTNHVFLHEWWLVNAKGEGSDGGGGGLAVGGFAHRDSQRVNLFCSAPISKRLNTTMVLARDGVVVSLNGLINTRHTISNGYSMEVCNKFMIGFPYDWDDYVNCHVQSRGAHADVLDRSNHSLDMARNKCQTTLEDVPGSSIRDMSKVSDLKSLMDEILAKVGHPKEKEEPSVKFAAKRCLSVPPVIDRASGCNKDDDMAPPSKKEPNICCQQEEAICSPNQISMSLSTRRAKRHLKSFPGEDSAEYNHNLHNASVEVENPPSKRKTRSSQLEDAVNCQNQMANSARSMNSVHKASLPRDVAGQDQDQLRDIDCDGLTPSKKDQSSSPRSIKSPLRASLGQDILEPGQTQLRNTNIEARRLAKKGESKCFDTDSIVNPSSRNGVSTRSMTRLKKPESTITGTFTGQG